MNYCFSLSFSVCILIIAHFTNGIVLFLMNYIKFIYIFKKSDLEFVLEAARTWDFVDRDKIILLGSSQGGWFQP